MSSVPKELADIVRAVDSRTSDIKPTMAIVVRGWNADLKAGLAAVERGWINLRVLCDEAALDPHLQQGLIPDHGVTIHHAAQQNDQLAELHNWCTSGDVDALLMGDLRPSHLFHLLANPYHHPSLEEGVSRAAVLSVPRYSKLLTIIGPCGPEKPLYDRMVLHMKNSYHLACGLGIERPKIALLSAMDNVGIDDLHTYNCHCLELMARVEQIPNLDVEGPMSFDTAIDRETAVHQGRTGPVAGQADIVIVDSHQTRSMLALTLSHFGQAQTARVIVGQRIPVAILPELTSPSDEERAIALALAIAPYMRTATPLDWQTKVDPIDYAW